MIVLKEFIWPTIQFLIQVGLMSIFIYAVLYYLRGTRSLFILVGICFTFIIGFFLSRFLDLDVFAWILSHIPTLIVFALLIIFQPELRRAFAEIGSRRIINAGEKQDINTVIDLLTKSVFYMSDRKIGALIVIERDIPMRSLSESGIAVNAPLSSELLSTIFWKDTPMHDGAVIIKDDHIVAASCFISQLSQADISKELGTRHRAGMGITEETDAIAIMVSEETGHVSLSFSGRLARNVDQQRLRRHLRNQLSRKREQKTGFGQTLTGIDALRTDVFKKEE